MALFENTAADLAEAELRYKAARRRAALAAVVAVTPFLGKPGTQSEVASFLLGNLDGMQNENPTQEIFKLYGCLKDETRPGLYEFLMGLTRDGYIEIMPKGNRKGLVLTAKGRQLVETSLCK